MSQSARQVEHLFRRSDNADALQFGYPAFANSPAKRSAASRSLGCEFQFDPLAETRLEFQCLDPSASFVLAQNLTGKPAALVAGLPGNYPPICKGLDFFFFFI